MADHIAFIGQTCLHRGDLLSIAQHINALASQDRAAPILIFECDTGRQVDIDTHGSAAELKQRFIPTSAPATDSENPSHVPKKRGRPKLGVIGREVTLLPRHWAWLDTQRGGASAALRRLVDQARKDHSQADTVRLAQDRTQRFLSALAGDLPGFEEATRALYAADAKAFTEPSQHWSKDVQKFARELADGAF